MRPKVNILARKTTDFRGLPADLAYHGGIDQLSLSFPEDVEDLVKLHREVVAKVESPADRIVVVLSLGRAYHRATYLVNARHRLSGVKQTGHMEWLWMRKTPLQSFVEEATAIYHRVLEPRAMP